MNKYEKACHEWLKGCSCAEENHPEKCEDCTQAFLNKIRKLKAGEYMSNIQNVIIDGVLYVPAKNIIVNKLDVMKVLVEEYMGETDDDKIERLASELWVHVTEDIRNYNEIPTIKEIVERMAI